MSEADRRAVQRLPVEKKKKMTFSISLGSISVGEDQHHLKRLFGDFLSETGVGERHRRGHEI